MSDIDPKLIEEVARAMCWGMGRDPDELVAYTGYERSPTGPYWHLQREWAIRFIAAHRALAAHPNQPQGTET